MTSFPKDQVAYARALATQKNPAAGEMFDELIKLAETSKKEATEACVAWLAKHANDYKPECLAEMMAKDLLKQ